MPNPRPHLDHARRGDESWAWIEGGWQKFDRATSCWRYSDPPPPEVERFNYRESILGKPQPLPEAPQ